jgi:hypothetical protein
MIAAGPACLITTPLPTKESRADHAAKRDHRHVPLLEPAFQLASVDWLLHVSPPYPDRYGARRACSRGAPTMYGRECADANVLRPAPRPFFIEEEETASRA